jgi:hypothetical protein
VLQTKAVHRFWHRGALALRTRRLIAASLAIACAVGGMQGAVAEQVRGSPVLVELFTSQGCSSCPPADANLGRLASDDRVIALSYNVDYWDYLGWRDTLAKPAFTTRQKAYARARGDGQIYTPQIVVNGLRHASGANSDAIARLISKTEADGISPAAPEITKRSEDGVTRISVGPAPGVKRKATVWLATVRRKVVTKVHRGENRGRKLAHYNVVRQMIPLGVWTGEKTDYQLDMAMLMKEGAEACAIIVQNGEAGPVIAAAWVHK